MKKGVKQMSKSLIQNNSDARETWNMLYTQTNEIYKNRNNVTLSDVSNLMSEIENVLKYRQLYSPSSADEKDLTARTQKLHSIIIPIHTNLCRVQPADWKPLEIFLEKAKLFS